MRDLLDELRELNPVPHCDRPAIEIVWQRIEADTADEARAGGGRGGKAVRGKLATALPLFVPAALAVGVSLAVLLVAFNAAGSRPHRSAGPSGSELKAWRTSNGQGPSLSAMWAHFAVLRRPATAKDRALRRQDGVAVGSSNTMQYPTFVRFLGSAGGTILDLEVWADFKHGSTGAVRSYSTTIGLGDTGSNYVKSNYLIFPALVNSAGSTRPAAEVSVVPDGVRTVRWQFECSTSSAGCVLPADRHTVTVHVRNNLAVLPVGQLSPGDAYASVTRVTWYRDDGTQSHYTSFFAGAPWAGLPSFAASRSNSTP